MSEQGVGAEDLARVEWSAVGASASDHIQIISFAIGDDQYGVDIMSVHELKSWTKVTQLPGQPDYVRGVMNLRGTMIPIVDLRCRFGQGLTEATPLHVVIVVQIDEYTVGLIVDRVSDIVSADPAKTQPVPRVTADEQLRSSFLSGLVTVGDEMIALIDLGNLVAASANATETEVAER
jgi:purine-binding chemotaxis protein CheW